MAESATSQQAGPGHLATLTPTERTGAVDARAQSQRSSRIFCHLPTRRWQIWSRRRASPYGSWKTHLTRQPLAEDQPAGTVDRPAAFERAALAAPSATGSLQQGRPTVTAAPASAGGEGENNAGSAWNQVLICILETARWLRSSVKRSRLVAWRAKLYLWL